MKHNKYCRFDCINNTFFALYVVFSIFILSSNSRASDKYEDEFDDEKPIMQDRFEKVNRNIFAFNDFFDSNFLAPVTRKYISITSTDFRAKARNAVTNAMTPSDIIISATQGDFESMSLLSWRFAINTTIGLFGIFDIASSLGLKPIQKNFSDTLAMLDVPMGDFIVLPFLGPSFTRNSIDLPVSYLLNGNFTDSGPIAYRMFGNQNLIVETAKDRMYNWVLFPFMLLDTRARLLAITDDIDASSLDRYKAQRDMYYQYAKYQTDLRIKLIKNGVFNREKHWNDINIRSASDRCIEDWQSKECSTDIISH